MKKLISIFVMFALLIPMGAMAKNKKNHPKKAFHHAKSFYVKPDSSLEEFEAKESCLGREVIFSTADMKAASFSRDETHSLKHDLHYACPECRCHLRTPGRCTCGKIRIPAVRHGSAWYGVTRDIGGLLTIGGELFQDPGPSKTTTTVAAGKHPKSAGHKTRRSTSKTASKTRVEKQAMEKKPAAPVSKPKAPAARKPVKKVR